MKTSNKRIILIIILIILIVALCSTIGKAQGTSNAPESVPDSVILSTDALDILANPYTDYFTQEDYQNVMSGNKQFVLYAEKASPFFHKESVFLKSFERLRTFPFKATYRTQHLELTKQNDGSLLIARAADPPKTKTFIWASIWIGLCFLIATFFLFSYIVHCLPDKNERNDLDWFIPWEDWDWEDYGMINAACTIALASIATLFIGTTMVGPSYDFLTASEGVIILLFAAALTGFVGWALHPFVGLIFRLAGEILAIVIKAVVWITVTAYFWIARPLWKLALKPQQEPTSIAWFEAFRRFLRKNQPLWLYGTFIFWFGLVIAALILLKDGATLLIGIVAIITGYTTLFRYLMGKSFFMEKKGPETAENNESSNTSNKQ